MLVFIVALIFGGQLHYSMGNLTYYEQVEALKVQHLVMLEELPQPTYLAGAGCGRVNIPCEGGHLEVCWKESQRTIRCVSDEEARGDLYAWVYYPGRGYEDYAHPPRGWAWPVSNSPWLPGYDAWGPGSLDAPRKPAPAEEATEEGTDLFDLLFGPRDYSWIALPRAGEFDPTWAPCGFSPEPEWCNERSDLETVVPTLPYRDWYLTGWEPRLLCDGFSPMPEWCYSVLGEEENSQTISKEVPEPRPATYLLVVAGIVVVVSIIREKRR